MIYLDRVTKYCKAGEGYFKAINDVSLAIETAEFVAILGPSGSGKSVLLRLMGGLLRPSEGSILVQGERLQELSGSKLSAFLRRNIGFVPQPAEFLDKTALQNVLRPLAPFKVMGDKVAYGKSMLKKVGLTGKEENKLGELSMGERQRLAIAQALITQPKMILADEPVSNLDERGKLQILELLGDINREGKTVVIATQDTRVASAAKRVMHIVDGKIEGALELPGKIKEERVIIKIE